jgi:hypothetical protein
MTRVVVSGSHWVGKSKVIEGVAARIGKEQLRVISGIMRTLMAQGFGVGPSTNLNTITAYIERQFSSEEEAFNEDVHVLSDRCLLVGCKLYPAMNFLLREMACGSVDGASN